MSSFAHHFIETVIVLMLVTAAVLITAAIVINVPALW